MSVARNLLENTAVAGDEELIADVAGIIYAGECTFCRTSQGLLMFLLAGSDPVCSLLLAFLVLEKTSSFHNRACRQSGLPSLFWS